MELAVERSIGKPERKVLLIDGLLGSVFVVNGLLSIGLPLTAADLPVFVAGTVVGVATPWLGERVTVSAIADRLGGPTALSVLLLAAFVALVAFVAAGPLFRRLAPGLIGIGVGILGYRFVFGVIGSIPDHRLEQARNRAV